MGLREIGKVLRESKRNWLIKIGLREIGKIFRESRWSWLRVIEDI